MKSCKFATVVVAWIGRMFEVELVSNLQKVPRAAFSAKLTNLRRFGIILVWESRGQSAFRFFR